MSGSADWARAHERAWQDVIAVLRAEGWTAEMTCFAAPVQIEGRLSSGEPFYFRARGEDPSEIRE
jgi:hypothetical protein